MNTVPQSSRPVKAFHAQYCGLSGILTHDGYRALFLDAESGQVVPVSEAEYANVIVLGEIAPAMRQFVADMLAGGYAAVACSRRMEV